MPITIQMTNDLYVDNYRAAIEISNLLNLFYDDYIDTINLVNEAEFEAGGVMSISTKFYKWNIRKR